MPARGRERRAARRYSLPPLLRRSAAGQENFACAQKTSRGYTRLSKKRKNHRPLVSLSSVVPSSSCFACAFGFAPCAATAWQPIVSVRIYLECFCLSPSPSPEPGPHPVPLSLRVVRVGWGRGTLPGARRLTRALDSMHPLVSLSHSRRVFPCLRLFLSILPSRPAASPYLQRGLFFLCRLAGHSATPPLPTT